MNIGPLKLDGLKLPFVTPPDRLGIEIEKRSLRVVKMRKGSERVLAIDAFGELDAHASGNSTTERGMAASPAYAADQQRLRQAIRQLGGGLVRAAASIEHPTLRIRRMSLPRMPEPDLIEAIRWNFKGQVEGAIGEYVVGYVPLEGLLEGNKPLVMAYGIAEQAIKEHVEFIKSLGLKPISIEPTATALFAAFYANGILEKGKHHVCVALGDSAAHFIVMRDKSMLFSRPLAAFSCDSLVKLIMRNLDLKEEVARELLWSWTQPLPDSVKCMESGEPSEESLKIRRIETMSGHFLSQLVIEVQRSISAFCVMYDAERVDDIYICGPGVLYPGLVKHIGEALRVETKVFNPFEKLMEASKQTAEVVRQAPLYAVAVGLAIP